MTSKERPTGMQRNVRLIMAIAADTRKQYEIAVSADLWPDELSAFKNGRRKPTPEQQEAIAYALGMQVADLFDVEVAPNG